jgi:uncharacterized protein YdaU (DUF1376 family)
MEAAINYYERHLGDYARDTGHLSLVEHGVYTLLLDRYYASEHPIPAADVYRVARARSKDERAAVDAVLAEFFKLEDGFYHQKRIDQEIEKYLAKGPQREKQKADAAERQRRARERRVELFEMLRQRGIVPHIKTTTGELERLIEEHDKCNTSALCHAGVTRDNTLTSHQTPVTNIKPIASAIGIPEGGTVAGSICARLKTDGVQGVNQQHPKLLKLLAEGLTADEITAIGPEAAQKGKGFAWVLAAAEGRRRDAVTVSTLPALPTEEWFLSASGIEAKAADHGLTQQRDETFPAFKARVYEAAGVTDEMVRRAKIDRGERV